MNDLLLNKKVSIERCIYQIRDYYGRGERSEFATDFLRQDAIAMNLQRIAECCIDIANHLVRSKKLGLPQNSADAFVLLADAGVITREMLASLKGMVGFRNVLVHRYQDIDLAIMVDVIENHLEGPLEFANLALSATSQQSP